MSTPLPSSNTDSVTRSDRQASGAQPDSTPVGSTPGTNTTPGGGTVTSVGLSMPSPFSVSGSPVSGAGTFVVSITAFTGTVALAKLTNGGAQGSLTVVKGLITAYTAPT